MQGGLYKERPRVLLEAMAAGARRNRVRIPRAWRNVIHGTCAPRDWRRARGGEGAKPYQSRGGKPSSRLEAAARATAVVGEARTREQRDGVQGDGSAAARVINVQSWGSRGAERAAKGARVAWRRTRGAAGAGADGEAPTGRRRRARHRDETRRDEMRPGEPWRNPVDVRT